jgi:transcription elongation GreA/GreB family factor
MSRAFVKDAEDAFEDLPERPISSAPNWVTEQGLKAIESEVARLSGELSKAGEDRYERARIGRDLRYWTARRASAHVAPQPTAQDRVQFGSTVTIDRDDGRRETFRIVGEDEADPSNGTISHVSPLARALMGKSEGDAARVNGADIEIAGIC